MVHPIQMQKGLTVPSLSVVDTFWFSKEYYTKTSLWVIAASCNTIYSREADQSIFTVLFFCFSSIDAEVHSGSGWSLQWLNEPSSDQEISWRNLAGLWWVRITVRSTWFRQKRTSRLFLVHSYQRGNHAYGYEFNCVALILSKLQKSSDQRM